MNLPRYRGIPFDHLTGIQIAYGVFYVFVAFYTTISTLSFFTGIEVLPNVIPHVLPWDCLLEIYNPVMKLDDTPTNYGLHMSEYLTKNNYCTLDQRKVAELIQYEKLPPKTGFYGNEYLNIR